MKMPQKDSKSSLKKQKRGVSISTPHLNGRIQKRATRRTGIAQVHGGHTESAFYLEAGTTKKRSYNGQEVRGGGSIKFY